MPRLRLIQPHPPDLPPWESHTLRQANDPNPQLDHFTKTGVGIKNASDYYNGEQTYYEYDAANELNQSQKLGTGWSYYQYDARGNCLTMLAPDGTTYYTYNSRDQRTRAT